MTKTIFNKLKQLHKKTYAIYSNYPVSCIIINDKGNHYYGVNIENSSYGLTMCAERVAIGNAIVDGSKKFKQIHILAGESNNIIGVPCGACRQVMNEFIDDNCEIYLWRIDGQYIKTNISSLIPSGFNKNFFSKE